MNDDRHTQTLGAAGEQTALAILQRRGYEIVATRWRCRAGEIDIIAREGGDLVFVEVRARTSGLDGARESITPRKQQQMLRVAAEYLDQHDLAETSWRVDAVVLGADGRGAERTFQVEIIRDAIDW
jgi:putative endonuclease